MDDVATCELADSSGNEHDKSEVDAGARSACTEETKGYDLQGDEHVA